MNFTLLTIKEAPSSTYTPAPLSALPFDKIILFKVNVAPSTTLNILEYFAASILAKISL